MILYVQPAPAYWVIPNENHLADAHVYNYVLGGIMCLDIDRKGIFRDYVYTKLLHTTEHISQQKNAFTLLYKYRAPSILCSHEIPTSKV